MGRVHDEEDMEKKENSLDIPGAEEDYQRLRSCRQRLSISRDYVADWTKADAFREFCQNWTDAIIKKSGVSREKLAYVHNDSNDEYTITVHHPITNKMLGYLFFFKKRGMLELCNFGSTLVRQALNMGATSIKDNNLAGKHGEGLKLAALVMVREGHQAKITASGFDWNFRWGANDTTSLWCYLSEVKRKRKSFSEGWEVGQLRFTDAMTSNPSQDVTTQLGNIDGKIIGKPIKEVDFVGWLKVYLHFNRPTDYVEAGRGTIIFEEEFADKIYFRGSLNESISAKGRYRYGYDFCTLDLDAGRDRKSVQDQVQLERTLADMWASAIKRCRAGTLDHYIEMLNDFDRWSDVSGIAQHMSRPTAVAIWNRLQTKIAGQKLFYYGQKDADRDTAFIMKFLDRQPVLMPNTMWLPLRRYRLIQTPSEYRNHKFPNAQVAVEADTTYAKERRDSESIIKKLEAQISNLRDENKGLLQQQEAMQTGHKELMQEKEQFQRSHEQLRREKEDLQSNNEELQQSKELLQTINEELRLKHEDSNVHSRTALDDNTSEMKAMKKLVTEAKAAEKVAQDKAAQASDLLRAARGEVKRAKEDKTKAENGEEAMMKTLERFLVKRRSASDDDAENRRRRDSGGGRVETEHGEGERAAKKIKVEDVIVLD